VVIRIEVDRAAVAQHLGQGLHRGYVSDENVSGGLQGDAAAGRRDSRLANAPYSHLGIGAGGRHENVARTALDDVGEGNCTRGDKADVAAGGVGGGESEDVVGRVVQRGAGS